MEQETQVTPAIAAIEIPDALLKVRFVTPTLIAAEQKLANDFYTTGQIDKAVVARQIVDNLLPAAYTTK